MSSFPLYRRHRLDVKLYPVRVESLHDEVDELVAAWRAQRPDLDVAPLQVLSRVSRLARHLDIARRAAFADHGLEPWVFDVLSALRRQGPPFQLTPGALLHATLVTSGTMTNRINRLEAAGLVRREPDPADRRGVLVTLTSAGAEVVDAALAELLDREQRLLAGLGPAEREQLAALLRTLLVPFDVTALCSLARQRRPASALPAQPSPPARPAGPRPARSAWHSRSRLPPAPHRSPPPAR